MTLNTFLKNSADAKAYPRRGVVERRWGQMLREPPSVSGLLTRAREAELLVPLAEVAEVRGGVVTRANAYFLLRELEADEIPVRFGVTSRDLKTIAVVEDGLKTLHRIERAYLKPVIKGPSMLDGPRSITASDQRLFDVGTLSKDALRKARANGALSYLKRGETHPYSVSEDRLKGGIPAQRSQVRNRKPYWYSTGATAPDSARIVVPEHFDERYVAALVPPSNKSVVLDKLFTVTPRSGVTADLIHASLNSTLTWLQIELRGRTQLGEGVLEMKVADWQGLLVLNASAIDDTMRQLVLGAFEQVAQRSTRAAKDELAESDRQALDEAYLSACGSSDARGDRAVVEGELRAAAAERHDRAHSMDAAKAGRRATRRATASVDSYATRIAASVEPFPDPRHHAPDEDGPLIMIMGPVVGPISVGDDLLTQGDVTCGGTTIAHAGDIRAAEFVRGVLLHDPTTTSVQLPSPQGLDVTTERWGQEIEEWRRRFDESAEAVLVAISDARLATEVRERALAILHAT